MVLPFSAMDNFRFILENPHPNATNAKQRKRARLVTACDSWYALPFWLFYTLIYPLF